MDKLKMETPDLTAANVQKIAALFPGVVAGGKVNFDLLRTMLGDEIMGDEAYEFTWVGKREAIREAGRPIRKTLRPCVEESKNWDTTENLYIEGDNLEVLKLLQESYLGKVKMIYIDPPYNTGNDFIYRDDFSVDKDEYDEASGVYDDDGDRLFRNTESNGRFHSDWCSMMYPRLVLARNLLSDDGVIFISIDNGELNNLTKICSEVFGADNFRNTILVRRRVKSLNSQFADNGLYSMNVGFEYVLVYAKSQTFFMNALRAKKSDASPKGRWDVFWSNADRPTMRYDILGFTPTTGQWRNSREKAEIAVANYQKYVSEFQEKMSLESYSAKTGITDFIRRIPNGTGKNGGVQHWVAPSDTALRTSNWTDIEVSQIGKEIDVPFDNPKSKRLLMELIKLVNVEDNYTLIDFFSGSATTAHAVMQLNAEDGGNRKFIMVQLPEVCAPDSEAAKAGYKNICEIGKERIRRAGEKIRAEIEAANSQLKLDGEAKAVPDIGFRVLKLDDSNMKDVYYAAGEYTQGNLQDMVSNIKDGRTDMDLLYGCLLDWGLPLSLPHTQEQIDGVTVHIYNDGDLIACFAPRVSEQVVKEIAGRQPLRVVFRDSSFAGSPEKINVEEIFKLFAPHTTVKVI
ncbi:site-specific DNA-methyltransferase [Desulfovibrio sp. ZJ200]|uniref:site-specific DNA-methyltransferase n=1 Tax=Desulfovibrio sp. ZJ200 TaxID=2709792 RepID=UPI0013ED7AC8|nr:site-specific DNA-methyltransferase [Desulfovibrio sp. ZJ200]